MPLNSSCPKCGRDVTDRDHREANAELAEQRAEGTPGGGLTQGWQHKKCPSKT
jgi:hypothetical protein